ncbi:hypothetical protein [Haloarcula sp. CBA1127]|uniref:hypothetical protein n=1 Tax=Haloarcula sp. CBA1127 TaxID=1765055 RepID=UPI00073F57BE|nr:hypothetical protein [Haloarcula sp. CBA1127]
MQCGKLGIVTDGWLEDPVAAEYRASEERFIDSGEKKFVRMLSVDDSTQATLSTIGDVEVYEGAALWDEEKEPEQWYPAGNTVEKGQSTVRQRTGTKWAAVPAANGHDGFAMTSTSAGAFAFKQLGARQTNCRIEPAYLDLRSWLEDKRDRLDVWEIGKDQPAFETTMTWSGRESLDADAIDEAIRDHAVLTLDVDYQDEFRRVSLAQSGWVEVFEPDMETSEFMEFVSSEILPYAFAAENEDEAVYDIVHERTDVGNVELTDESQTSLDDLDSVTMSGGEADAE